MTLYQISYLYGEDAMHLRLRITELRQAMRAAPTQEEAASLKARIDVLNVLLRQSRELAEHTRHYYERSYCRNAKYTL